MSSGAACVAHDTYEIPTPLIWPSSSTYSTTRLMSATWRFQRSRVSMRFAGPESIGRIGFTSTRMFLGTTAAWMVCVAAYCLFLVMG